MRTKVTVVAVVAGMLAAGGAKANVAEWIVPSIHFSGAVGASSADHVEDLAVGHHDPSREGGTLQGLELGLSLRASDHLQGFATYTLHYGAAKEWDGEWEEVFLKLAKLPGGFELRGGRMLARYGAYNAIHLHGWDFVDMPLATGLLLGEDGLALDGGDVTWTRRFGTLTAGIVAGYGKAVSHDHGHDDHADDHHDDDPAHHGHGWEDEVGYGRLFGLYQPNDFNRWTVGLSGAFGDNEDHRTRAVYGLDVTYLWRENGLLPGGRALRWTSEALLMHQAHSDRHHEDDHDHDDDHADDHDGDDDHADDTLFGLYSQAVWTWNEKLDTGLRIGYVEGEGDREARVCVSPAVTYRPLGSQSVHLRLQYNYDDLKSTTEHTVWAQLGLSWGGPEVR